MANFSLDLPEASVAIQVSGSFGSRQEEAQRLGRILRPKSDGRGARFYTVVTRDTVDADFAAHRQRFLAEQGYAYRIVDADDVLKAWPTEPPRRPARVRRVHGGDLWQVSGAWAVCGRFEARFRPEPAANPPGRGWGARGRGVAGLGPWGLGRGLGA